MAAAVEAPPVHSTDQAGTSAAASVTLKCQDLGNIVHLEHLNLEVRLNSVHSALHPTWAVHFDALSTQVLHSACRLCIGQCCE